MSAESSSARPMRFDVTKHVSDGGGGSISGALQLASILISVGILLGFIASYVSQWFFLVVIFPLLMGFGLGLVGAITIKHYKIRRPIVCGAAGFVAGCFCLLTMHYSDYRRLESALADQPEAVLEIARNIEQLEAKMSELPPEIREVIGELRKNPEMLRVFKIRNLWDFMKYQAENGVTLSSKRGQDINLGYTGSFIYWGVECLLVAGVCWAMMNMEASKPFCADCNRWKVEKPLLVSTLGPKEITDAVNAGDLRALESALTSSDANQKPSVYTKMLVHVCDACDPPATFEIKVVKVTVNAKNEHSNSDQTLMTYPGEALVPLQELTERVTAPPAAVVEATEVAESESEPA